MREHARSKNLDRQVSRGKRMTRMLEKCRRRDFCAVERDALACSLQAGKTLALKQLPA